MKFCVQTKSDYFIRVCLLLSVLIIQGCATYSQAFHPVENKLAGQDPAGALKILEDQDHSDSDKLLYLLNKAMLQRMQNNYSASNETFEQAKLVVDSFSATSIREHSASFIYNDTSLAYSGTPLDQVMLHTYATLNYLELNRIDEARVEILQTDLRLRQLMDNAPNSALSVDPFSQYLAGMVYEDLGEYSDAMIAYRKAMIAYQTHNKALYPITVPKALKFDLIRTARRIGLDNESKQLMRKFNLKKAQIPPHSDDDSEVVLILHNGLAPVKQEKSVGLIDPSSGQLIRVSLPYYLNRPKPMITARLRAVNRNDKNQIVEQYEALNQAEVVEQIDAIDHETLESYLPAITARALARAVVKYQAAREANRQNGWAGLLINLAGFATERADTRSWLTLPAEIQLARLRLKMGQYDLSLALLDNSNHQVKTIPLGRINLLPGKRRYISYHHIPSYIFVQH